MPGPVATPPPKPPRAPCGARSWRSASVSARRAASSARRARSSGAWETRSPSRNAAASIARGYLANGNEALQSGDYGRARTLWRHVIRVFHSPSGHGPSVADDALALGGIAECEMRLESRDRALIAVRQALELAGQSRNPVALAYCHLWESHALKAAGKIEAARRACECARDAAEQLDHDPILGECLKAESLLNDLSGRFESAQDLEQRAERVELERAALLAREPTRSACSSCGT